MAVSGLTGVGLASGDMDRDIVLQVASKVQSSSGEEVYDWANADEQTIAAEWLPGATAESWRSQQRLGAYLDGVFRIYDIDPRPTPDNARIVFDGRAYDIKGVTEIGRGQGLEIAAVARGESLT